MHTQNGQIEPLEKATDNHLNNTCVAKLNKRSLFQPFLGLFYIFLTCIFLTLNLVTVKQLTYISIGQLTLIRYTGVFVGSLPFAVYSVKEILGPKKDRILLIIRGFFIATCVYLSLIGVRYIPLAEAAVILSTSPVLVSVIARFYLKEPCGVVQSTCILISICGVLLSIRLPELLSEENKIYRDLTYLGGLAASVGGVLMLAVSLVSLRKMKDVHSSVVLIYTGFIGCLETALVNYFVAHYEVPHCGEDVLRITMLGVLAFLGHWTLILAIQVEAVGTVSIMKACLDIVVAMVFEIIFFQIQPDIYSISGACLVILSVSVIGTRNWMLTLPDDCDIRKRFKYLLL